MRAVAHACIPETAMRLKAAAMPRQLGMMVHFLPNLSAATDAGMTTIRLTIAIAENVIPAHTNRQAELNHLLAVYHEQLGLSIPHHEDQHIWKQVCFARVHPISLQNKVMA